MISGTKNNDTLPHGEEPLITGNPTFGAVTEKISKIVEKKTPPIWFLAVLLTASLAAVLFGSIGYLVWEGVGIWGLNNPVGWGWAIVNFVFWVGIGHAGDPVSSSSTMADIDQPLCRSNDIICRCLCPDFPRHTCRPNMGCLFYVSDPKPDADVAEFPKPAFVGRFRCRDILYRLASILVYRSYS
jgi:hypothetical protein